MPKRSPPRENVYRWEELAEEYAGADLLLGNGFSLLFSPSFAYESLFDKFLEAGRDREREVFPKFGTKNFEAILEQFVHAKNVNEALGASTSRIIAAHNALRNGLVKAIEANHPRYADLDEGRLKRYTATIDSFGDVFTLNYDIIIYHMIMLAKDRHGRDPRHSQYNDYYWGQAQDGWLEFRDYNLLPGYKYVYYLHGALFLFHDRHRDVKIRRTPMTELIEEVSSNIRNGLIPLFVSEGSAADKRLAISRSDYLRFCHDNLRANLKQLVIFGTSLSLQDDHIVEAIRQDSHHQMKKTQVAVGIHVHGKTPTEIAARTAWYRARLEGLPIDFFDSSTLFS